MTRPAVLGALLLLVAATAPAQSLFDLPPGVETRWYSFENPSGRRGEGGLSQAGRKGAASKTIHAGETVVLADVGGPGVVRRIWQLRGLPEEQRPELVRTHQRFPPSGEAAKADAATWENFETRQDVCATAYWYQALPSPRWPALEPYADRVKDLGLPPKP